MIGSRHSGLDSPAFARGGKIEMKKSRNDYADPQDPFQKGDSDLSLSMIGGIF
jgi:hypothetical protein